MFSKPETIEQLFYLILVKLNRIPMNSLKQLKKLSQVGSALIAASKLCLIFAFICITFFSFPSIASASSLPTKIWEKEQSRVLLPDWSQIIPFF